MFISSFLYSSFLRFFFGSSVSLYLRIGCLSITIVSNELEIGEESGRRHESAEHGNTLRVHGKLPRRGSRILRQREQAAGTALFVRKRYLNHGASL